MTELSASQYLFRRFTARTGMRLKRVAEHVCCESSKAGHQISGGATLILGVTLPNHAMGTAGLAQINDRMSNQRGGPRYRCRRSSTPPVLDFPMMLSGKQFRTTIMTNAINELDTYKLSAGASPGQP
jgi:hypothetical protein